VYPATVFSTPAWSPCRYSRTLLDQPITAQPVKKFPVFHVIWNFITDFIRTHPEPAHSNPYLYTVSVRLLSLLHSHPRLSIPHWCDVIQPIFSSPYVSHILSSCYTLCPAYPSRCTRLGIIRWREQIIKLRIVCFSLVLQYFVSPEFKCIPQRSVIKRCEMLSVSTDTQPSVTLNHKFDATPSASFSNSKTTCAGLAS
jgi:hypothetical protein